MHYNSASMGDWAYHHWGHPEKTFKFLCDSPKKNLPSTIAKNPPFLPNSSSLLSQSGLAEVEIAFDSLHMIGGILESIVQSFRTNAGLKFQDNSFLASIQKLMSKSMACFFICRLAKTFFAVRNKFNSLFSKKIRTVNTPPLPTCQRWLFKRKMGSMESIFHQIRKGNFESMIFEK